MSHTHALHSTNHAGQPVSMHEDSHESVSIAQYHGLDWAEASDQLPDRRRMPSNGVSIGRADSIPRLNQASNHSFIEDSRQPTGLDIDADLDGAAQYPHIEQVSSPLNVMALANLMKVTVSYDHQKLTAILRDILARLHAQESLNKMGQSRTEKSLEKLTQDFAALQDTVRQMQTTQVEQKQDVDSLRVSVDAKLNEVMDTWKAHAQESSGDQKYGDATDAEADSLHTNLSTPDILIGSPRSRKSSGIHSFDSRVNIDDGQTPTATTAAGEPPGTFSTVEVPLQQVTDLEGRVAKLERALRDSIAEREQLRVKYASAMSLAEQGASALARIAQTRTELGALQALANTTKQRLDELQGVTLESDGQDPTESMVGGMSMLAWSRSNQRPTKSEVAGFVQEVADQLVGAAISDRLVPLHERTESAVQDCSTLTQRVGDLERNVSADSDAVVALQDNAADLRRELQQQIQRINATNRSVVEVRNDIDAAKEATAAVEKSTDARLTQVDTTLGRLQAQVAKAQEQAERAHGGLSALQLRFYQLATSGHTPADLSNNTTQSAASSNSSTAAHVSRPTTIVATGDTGQDTQHAIKLLNQRIDDVTRECSTIRKYAGGIEERNMRAISEQHAQLQTGLSNCAQRTELMGKKTRAALVKQLADFERDILYLLGSARGFSGAAAMGGFGAACVGSDRLGDAFEGDSLAAAAKVQYRCLTCDQPTGGMLGPESQLHLHSRLLNLQKRSKTGGDFPQDSSLASSASSTLQALKAQADGHSRALHAASEGGSAGCALESARRDAQAAAELDAVIKQSETSLSARANLQRALDLEQRAVADQIAAASSVVGDNETPNLPEVDAAARELASKLAQVRPSTVPVDVETSMPQSLLSSEPFARDHAAPHAATSSPGQLASRSLMVVERGQEMSVYGKDGHVYRGRGNTRVLFAPPSKARDRRFQLSYLDGTSSGTAVSGRTALAAAAAAQAIATTGALDTDALALALSGTHVVQPTSQQAGPNHGPQAGRRSVNSGVAVPETLRIPTTAVPTSRRTGVQDLSPTVFSVHPTTTALNRTSTASGDSSIARQTTGRL